LLWGRHDAPSVTNPKRFGRSLSDAVAATEPPLEQVLASALQALPRPMLFSLRRDLALSPFPDALRPLRDAAEPEASVAAAALDEAGCAAAVRAISSTLGPRHRCWAFSLHEEAVAAACGALAALPPEGREELLGALRGRQRQGFCATVRQCLGRSRGQPLIKLGRPRTAWLLGACADDPIASAAPEGNSACIAVRRRRRRRRETPLVQVAWSSDRDTDSEGELAEDVNVDSEVSTCESRSS